MNDPTIHKLAQLLRESGDKILTSEFKFNFKFSVSLLTTLNNFFLRFPSSNYNTETCDNPFQVLRTSAAGADIQLIHDFIQRTVVLWLYCFPNDPQDTIINITKFKNVKILEIQKISVKQIKGIQQIRAQLEQIKCTQCLNSIQEIITDCGADNSSSFSWNNLIKMDLSFNNLNEIDNSLEFVQNLRYLNISHNKLSNVDSLNVLPNLIMIDLSFNRLTKMPLFHVDALGKIEIINLNHNLIETLTGTSKLEALFDLNLANNCFVDQKNIVLLSRFQSLKCLQFDGNPLSFHPKHRNIISSNLHINAANGKFILNGIELNRTEKSNCGKIGLSSYHHSISKPENSSNFFGSTNSISSISQTENISSVKISKNVKPRKKRNSRLIEIDKNLNITDLNDTQLYAKTPSENGHLITKKHIESLRQQYGSDWLTKSDCEHNQEIPKLMENAIDKQSHVFYKTPSYNSLNEEEISSTSTSFNDNNNIINNSTTTTAICSLSNTSDYKLEEDLTSLSDNKNNSEEIILDKVYKNSENEGNVMEPSIEDKDITDKHLIYYVISQTNCKEILLQVSNSSIKEKDNISGSTLSKWNLTILESCDRLKSNTLRINFDTIRRDKQERIYVFKNEKQSSELESFLRNILSERSLCEMNQQIYKCLNCNCQFSVEIKIGRIQEEITCPDCKSLFLCEQKDNPNNLQNTYFNNKELPNESDVEIISDSSSSRSSSVEVLIEDNPTCSNSDNGLALEANDLIKISIFDTIIQSTNELMSKSNQITNLSIDKNSSKYKFNYVDFSDVDHRLKFYFYQTLFQENNEQFKWIVKTKFYIEGKNLFVESGVLVMSTSKLYLMQIFSLDYTEDVSKWMRQLQTIPVENIEIVEMLPYNVGVCIHLKSYGRLLLILQDFLRCESLINFLMQRKEFPPECRFYREECLEKLMNGVDECDIEMLTIVNNVAVITDNLTTTNFVTTVLYLTKNYVFLSNPANDSLWLLPKSNSNISPNIASQNLGNLIEIKNLSDNRFSLCFSEETLNEAEIWDCMFETKGSMDYCLKQINTYWSALFGVSLLNN